mgnify:CR=1 FL=1
MVPPDFEQATIALQDGSQLTAKIIWEEDVKDPGPFRISGFELVDQVTGNPHDAQSSPRLGDTFSFATGSKTFLDHRDTEPTGRTTDPVVAQPFRYRLFWFAGRGARHGPPTLDFPRVGPRQFS